MVKFTEKNIAVLKYSMVKMKSFNCSSGGGKFFENVEETVDPKPQCSPVRVTRSKMQEPVQKSIADSDDEIVRDTPKAKILDTSGKNRLETLPGSVTSLGYGSSSSPVSYSTPTIQTGAAIQTFCDSARIKALKGMLQSSSSSETKLPVKPREAPVSNSATKSAWSYAEQQFMGANRGTANDGLSSQIFGSGSMSGSAIESTIHPRSFFNSIKHNELPANTVSAATFLPLPLIPKKLTPEEIWEQKQKAVKFEKQKQDVAEQRRAEEKLRKAEELKSLEGQVIRITKGPYKCKIGRVIQLWNGQADINIFNGDGESMISVPEGFIKPFNEWPTAEVARVKNDNAFLNETKMEQMQVLGFKENIVTQAFPSSPSHETELETKATQMMVIGQTAAGTQEKRGSEASSPLLSEVSKIVGEHQNISTTSFQKPPEEESPKVLDYFRYATFEELLILEGCSERKAEVILSMRPFGDWDDLVSKFQYSKVVSKDLIAACKEIISVWNSLKLILEKCQKISTNLETFVSALSGKTTSISNDICFVVQQQPSSNLAGSTARQMIGVNWLQYLNEHNLNGIIGDEADIRKIIRTLLADFLMENSGPHLILTTSSKIDVWSQELQSWCPSLTVLLYEGGQNQRRDIQDKKMNFNIILTSYQTRLDDDDFFDMGDFHLAIYDEGHMLKNMTSVGYEKYMKISARCRLLMIGSMQQNNLAELMSLCSFVMPDSFASHQESLAKIFTILALKTGSSDQRDSYKKETLEHARRVLQPFFLRRLENKLPMNTDLIDILPLTSEQQDQQFKQQVQQDQQQDQQFEQHHQQNHAREDF